MVVREVAEVAAPAAPSGGKMDVNTALQEVKISIRAQTDRETDTGERSRVLCRWRAELWRCLPDCLVFNYQLTVVGVEEGLDQRWSCSRSARGCQGSRQVLVSKLHSCLYPARRQAHLCVLASNCTEPAYSLLVEALCAEHGIPLIKVEDNKKLGEMVGLCKIDKDGNPRKIVGCSCVVVKVCLGISCIMFTLSRTLVSRERLWKFSSTT